MGVGIFGSNVDGTLSNSIPLGWCTFSRFQATGNGKVITITPYLNIDGSSVICGIYDDLVGAPKNLLGVTNVIHNHVAGFVWYDFTLVTPVPITNGAFYWLGWLSDTVGRPVYRLTPGAPNQNDAQNGLVFPNLPDPFTGVFFDASYMAIYATYTFGAIKLPLVNVGL